ncbi:MAG: peptide chain release factor N(5)-glutamine methyltransferase [candidate division KSB1 bacterium]|jgi:release factor glutamine methyltransferase|nr:peptide chain release factor N(5)-glutamine methyltransferase [candidate division KSB1 bacterium]
MPDKWTLIDILNTSVDYLKKKGFENSRLDIERLLCHSLQLKRVDLYVNFERLLTNEEISNFKALLKRRLGNEPLQYILGETEFMSLRFKVNPSVLIPRPETEVLVEKVIEIFRDADQPAFMDIGTGSGNIAISVAKHLSRSRIVCVDIDDGALEVASANAAQNDVADRLVFVKADVTDSAFHGHFDTPFDAVISNPPYISRADYEELPEEIKKHEPLSALLGGEDGMDYYKAIVTQANNGILNEKGVLALEIGYDQREDVESLLEQSQFQDIETLSDLAGRDRVVIARKSSK